MSVTKEFEINGKKFYYYYSGKDTRGVDCAIHMVDGKQVKPWEFHCIISNTLGLVAEPFVIDAMKYYSISEQRKRKLQGYTDHFDQP